MCFLPAYKRCSAKASQFASVSEEIACFPSSATTTMPCWLPPEGKRIRRGTVVVAQTDESGIVLHRIRRIDRDGRITLLGDGNTNIFEHTDCSRIIAVVTRYYRGKHSFSPESPLMRLVGLLWCDMHPWRRHLLTVLWKIKKSITTNN